MTGIKKVLLLTCVLITTKLQVVAQSEFSLVATPTITSKPKVINPSPAKIYGENRISFEGGIDYTYIFKDKPFGIRFGTGIGIVDHNYVFIAPRNAFGTMTGNGNEELILDYENYRYNSISAQFVYQIRLKNLVVETYAGLSKKFYQYSNQEEGLRTTFNRNPPYNYDDPNAGPVDFSVRIPPINGRLHLDVPIGIGIKRYYRDRSSLTFGIVKNWSLESIGKGELFVQMYNQPYHGEFSPKSSFLGLDLRYGYSLKKRVQVVSRNEKTEKSGYKKAVFMEMGGNGYGFSINYDLRVKKVQNNGLGLRTGIGIGKNYDAISIEDSHQFIAIPLNINYIIGKRRSGLETGLGITPNIALDKMESNSTLKLGAFLNINYRYQPLKEGFVFRMGNTPYYSKRKFEIYYPTISLGYGFK